MRKSRFTVAQIVDFVREYDAGVSRKELARKHDVRVNTLRLWKAKHADMDVSDVVKLKQLEAENMRMHRIIARQTLKIDAMDELIRKKRRGRRSDKTRRWPCEKAVFVNVEACAIMRTRRRSSCERPRIIFRRTQS